MAGTNAHAQLIAGTCAPLFTPEYGTCSEADLNHIFSGYVCQYEQIVANIFSQVYCAVQEAMVDPLTSLLTLFVAVLGAAILMGVVPFTQKDIGIAVARIALLVAFAANAEFLVGILYTGVMGFITGGVELVLRVAPGSSNSGQNLLARLDELVNQFLHSGAVESAKGTADDGNQCNDSPLPFFATLLFTAPPIFLIGLMMLLKLALVFLRAVVGYLFAITAIMFLIVLAPVFLSAGLFKATRHLFENWMKYLISFAVQVVVVFAFIGFVLSMGVEEDFRRLVNLSVPYNDNTWANDNRINFNNWCTICAQNDGATCLSQEPVPPAGMFAYADVLQTLGTEILVLLVLAYLIEAVLKLAPEVAMRLGNMPTAASVGGFADSIAGVSSISYAGQRMGQAFRNGSGGMTSRAGASVSEGYNALIRGGKDQPGIIRSMLGEMLGRQ